MICGCDVVQKCIICHFNKDLMYVVLVITANHMVGECNRCACMVCHSTGHVLATATC